MMENTTVVDAASGLIKASGKLVIKNLVEVMEGFKPGTNIQSEQFKIGDVSLLIEVDPNGVTDSYKGFVSVLLINKGDVDISVKCELITDLITREITYKDTMKAGSGLGWEDFLTHAQCAEAYKSKDFVVTAKVEMPGEPSVILGPDFSPAPRRHKFNVLERVFDKMEKTDFTLVFDGEEVPCHKHILAAASPVFEAMVENQHMEAITCKANIELSKEVGRAFVRFIYTGDLEDDLLEEHSSAFLALGEMYDLQELKDMAEVKLLSKLKRENMVEMISMGELYRAENIFEAALKMTKNNMTWLRNQV